MKYLLIIAGVLSMVSCKDNKFKGYNPTPYQLNVPAEFPDMKFIDENPLTVQGVQLGRMLYYDNLLHPNQSMSCSSCHDQINSFSNTVSNSLPHINLGFVDKFLWNGKVEGTLEDIMMFEVEEFFQTDISLLQNDDNYPDLFFQAFGSKTIDSKRTAYALAQFFRVLNSTDSKFDRVKLGLESMTPEEWDGYDIFFSERGDCFHCHGGALMTDNLFHNNALDSSPEDGRYVITSNPNDIGKFKTPTLRNVELTGPYMHDGRYQTLEEVVEFYSSGLQYSPTVDPLMKNLDFSGVGLSTVEKENLVLFLKTLTDNSYTTNPDLSNPF